MGSFRTTVALAALVGSIAAFAAPAGAVRLKDLADVEGVRDNPLVGVGIVVGLAGTGDDASSAATRRPLAAMVKRLGIQISETEIKAKNVAIVAVTTDLPPFARPGQNIDVVVSSMGSAKSLQGGTLIVTPLKGADLRTYAIAQGPLMLGGFAVSAGSGSTTQKNHPTVARIPGGAVIERDAPGTLAQGEVTLILREADFTTAARIAGAVDAALGPGTARVRDPGAVTVMVGEKWRGRVVSLVALLEGLEAEPDAPARVIIDERTGTIVVGEAVRLGPAAIAHGGISVKVDEQSLVSQPSVLAGGSTAVTPSSSIDVTEEDGHLAFVPGATTVGELAAALDALGAKPRDLVAIFQALKAAGALRAEIKVQ